MQKPKQALESVNLGLDLSFEVGVVVVGVDAVAVLDAVAEPGIHHVDAELLHQQPDVAVYRGDVGRY